MKQSFQFDIDYISWKKWDDNGGFGEFSLAESFYYRSEPARLKGAQILRFLGWLWYAFWLLRLIGLGCFWCRIKR